MNLNPKSGTISVVLASASKIRSRILNDAGIKHICDPARIDEAALKTVLKNQAAGVETVAAALAAAKASEVSSRYVNAFVIGADQILECESRLFDKPPDPKAAGVTLKALRGRRHRLVSAVSVFRKGECVWRHLETPSLTMRDFSDSFLACYIEDGVPEILESVGGYRLEGTGVQLFTGIEGNYFTILGLPLLALLDFLRKVGVAQE
jgi:septum formation protein